MTTYQITTKTDTQSAVGPVVIGVETSVITITAQAADYIPEVYLDLSPMMLGDTTVVTEYLAIDGTNYQIYFQNTYSGVQTIPALRFHGKLIELNMLYKITIKQTAGTGRTYPFASVVQIFSA